jgi:hypothetical protein
VRCDGRDDDADDDDDDDAPEAALSAFNPKYKPHRSGSSRRHH